MYPREENEFYVSTFCSSKSSLYLYNYASEKNVVNGVKQKLSFTITISIQIIMNRAILNITYIFQNYIYRLRNLLGRTAVK